MRFWWLPWNGWIDYDTATPQTLRCREQLLKQIKKSNLKLKPLTPVKVRIQKRPAGYILKKKKIKKIRKKNET